VDFDRARVSVGDSNTFHANLKRLHRSLEKLWPSRADVSLDNAWKVLMAGYAQGAS